MQRYLEYLMSAWDSVSPTLIMLSTIFSYILFPQKAYETAAIGLAGAMVLDILTKYYSLARIHGGLWRAMRDGHIKSSKLWEGTVRKLIGYLSVMILAGLSIRVSPLEQLAVFFSTVVYTIMFWRECQSVLEHLIDAGHTEWKWLLVWVKRQKSDKIKSILNKQNNSKDSDNDQSVG